MSEKISRKEYESREKLLADVRLRLGRAAKDLLQAKSNYAAAEKLWHEACCYLPSVYRISGAEEYEVVAESGLEFIKDPVKLFEMQKALDSAVGNL